MINRIVNTFVVGIPAVMVVLLFAGEALADVGGDVIDKSTSKIIETTVFGALALLEAGGIAWLLNRSDKKDTAHAAAMKESKDQSIALASQTTEVMADVRAAIVQSTEAQKETRDAVDDLKDEVSQVRSEQARIVERLDASAPTRAAGRAR